MSESSAGLTKGAKAKARMDVEVVLGSILLSVLCGTVVATLAAWPLGIQRGIRVGIYVCIGLFVFILVLHVWRIRLERIGQIFTERASPNLSPPSHGPRNHIICLDGTWNLPAAPMNVRKLFKRLVQDSQKQIARYSTIPGLALANLPAPERNS